MSDLSCYIIHSVKLNGRHINLYVHTIYAFLVSVNERVNVTAPVLFWGLKDDHVSHYLYR